MILPLKRLRQGKILLFRLVPVKPETDPCRGEIKTVDCGTERTGFGAVTLAMRSWGRHAANVDTPESSQRKRRNLHAETRTYNAASHVRKFGCSYFRNGAFTFARYPWLCSSFVSGRAMPDIRWILTRRGRPIWIRSWRISRRICMKDGRAFPAMSSFVRRCRQLACLSSI